MKPICAAAFFSLAATVCAEHTVTCRTIGLTLDGRGRVVSLRHGDLEMLSPVPPVGLWQLALIRPVAYTDPLPPIEIPQTAYLGHESWANRFEYGADLVIDSNNAPLPAITGNDSGLALQWAVPVPGGEALVKASIAAETERLAFRIDVKLPDSWALKRVTFPRLRGLGSWTRPQADAVLFPVTWGILRRNPLAARTNFSGQYPSHINWCQMAAWLHGDRGLYLGMLDPDSNHTGIDAQYVEGAEPAPLETDPRYLQTMLEPVQAAPLAERLAAGAQPSMQLRCHHWPEIASSWHSTYPVVMQGFRGSWYDAAQLHRRWALQQRWCRRGPLSARRDEATSLAGLDLWIMRYGFSPGSHEPLPASAQQAAVLKLLDAFGMPFGLHWYQWHAFNWHTRFPAHQPVVDGFAAAVKELQRRGVVIMPYCQGRLLYRDRPDIDRERAYASVEANGQPYLEMYTPQDDWPLALCSEADWSQQQWLQAAGMLWQEYGVDGVYFDQITAMMPSLCYHAGHGHSLGGGNHHWRGYDRALAAMAPMVAADSRRFLCSELMADAYLDRIDLYLSFVPALEDYVPLHAAIYGGYTTVVGRSTPSTVLQDPQLLAISQGEQLLFGGQLGWVSDSVLQYPQAVTYIRDLARLRSRVREFLHYGSLLPPLPLRCQARLRRNLPAALCHNGPVALDRPAVRCTAWLGADGRRLLLLLNQHREAAAVTVEVPADWPPGQWLQWQLGSETAAAAAIARQLQITLPPFAVSAIVQPRIQE